MITWEVSFDENSRNFEINIVSAYLTKKDISIALKIQYSHHNIDGEDSTMEEPFVITIEKGSKSWKKTQWFNIGSDWQPQTWSYNGSRNNGCPVDIEDDYYFYQLEGDGGSWDNIDIM